MRHRTANRTRTRDQFFLSATQYPITPRTRNGNKFKAKIVTPKLIARPFAKFANMDDKACKDTAENKNTTPCCKALAAFEFVWGISLKINLPLLSSGSRQHPDPRIYDQCIHRENHPLRCASASGWAITAGVVSNTSSSRTGWVFGPAGRRRSPG